LRCGSHVGLRLPVAMCNNSATLNCSMRAIRSSSSAMEREERYLIVACTVITDVPEAVGP
jgi:hypothetical protein